MNDDEIAQLENEDEWDFETVVRQRARPGRRAIVSVGFKTAEFTIVAEAAQKRDQLVSQFIREAALERARAHDAKGMTRQIRTITIQSGPRHIEAVLLEALRSRGRLSALR